MKWFKENAASISGDISTMMSAITTGHIRCSRSRRNRTTTCHIHRRRTSPLPWRSTNHRLDQLPASPLPSPVWGPPIPGTPSSQPRPPRRRLFDPSRRSFVQQPRENHPWAGHLSVKWTHVASQLIRSVIDALQQQQVPMSIYAFA